MDRIAHPATSTVSHSEKISVLSPGVPIKPIPGHPGTGLGACLSFRGGRGELDRFWCFGGGVFSALENGGPARHNDGISFISEWWDGFDDGRGSVLLVDFPPPPDYPCHRTSPGSSLSGLPSKQLARHHLLLGFGE